MSLICSHHCTRLANYKRPCFQASQNICYKFVLQATALIQSYKLESGVIVRVHGLTIKLLLSRTNLLLEARGQEEVRGFVNSN